MPIHIRHVFTWQLAHLNSSPLFGNIMDFFSSSSWWQKVWVYALFCSMKYKRKWLVKFQTEASWARVWFTISHTFPAITDLQPSMRRLGEPKTCRTAWNCHPRLFSPTNIWKSIVSMKMLIFITVSTKSKALNLALGCIWY